MSEIDFDRLIDAVRNAVELSSVEDRLASFVPTKAANDNRASCWPIIPFPEGWDVA